MLNPLNNFIAGRPKAALLFLFLGDFRCGVSGRIAQSVAHLTQEPEVPGSIPGPVTYFRSPSADSRRAVVSYWRTYVHDVLVNRLGGLSLPRKGVDMLTDRPDMTIDVYKRKKNRKHNGQLLLDIKQQQHTHTLVIYRYSCYI